MRARNVDEAVARAFRLRLGEGISGRAFAERRPVWTGDRAADRTLGLSEETIALLDRATDHPRAMIAVPIAIRDDAYGVLIAYRAQPHEWGEEEIRLLSQLSAPAAVAIDNARLHAETQQNLAGAGLLNEAARTLHRALDVRRRLPASLADLGRTFGPPASASRSSARPVPRRITPSRGARQRTREPAVWRRAAERARCRSSSPTSRPSRRWRPE